MVKLLQISLQDALPPVPQIQQLIEPVLSSFPFLPVSRLEVDDVAYEANI